MDQLFTAINLQKASEHAPFRLGVQNHLSRKATGMPSGQEHARFHKPCVPSPPPPHVNGGFLYLKRIFSSRSISVFESKDKPLSGTVPKSDLLPPPPTKTTFTKPIQDFSYIHNYAWKAC